MDNEVQSINLESISKSKRKKISGSPKAHTIKRVTKITKTKKVPKRTVVK